MNISFGSSELEFHWEEPARSTRANLNHPQYTQSQFRRKRPEPITFAIGWRFVFDFVGTIGPIAARRLKKLVFAIVDMGSFAYSCEVDLAACVGTACALAVCAPSALIIRPNAAVSRVFFRFIWGLTLYAQFQQPFGQLGGKSLSSQTHCTSQEIKFTSMANSLLPRRSPPLSG